MKDGLTNMGTRGSMVRVYVYIVYLMWVLSVNQGLQQALE